MAQHKVKSGNSGSDTLYYSLREEDGVVYLEVENGEGFENVIGVLGDGGLDLWSLDDEIGVAKDKSGYLKITRD